MAFGSSEGQIRGISNLRECDNEELTPQEPRNTLLVTKDNTERIAWHVVAKLCSVRVLEKLWECAKQRHTTGELKQTLFLEKHLMG